MSTRRILGTSVLLTIVACSGDDQPPPPPPPSYGSAVITWSIQDQSGNALTCQELSISQATVQLGRESMVVACGDEQRVRFEQVLAGPYGVTLYLDVPGRGPLVTLTNNLPVIANQEATLEMIAVVDIGSIDKGGIRFHWTVAGGTAAANCGLVGAKTVHIATQPSSITQFTHDVDCTDGELVLDALAAGVYEVRAEMQDLAGTRIGPPQSFQIRVNEGDEADVPIIFYQDSGDPAAFYGTWTITSTAGAATCTEVNADRVRISLQVLPRNQQPFEIASATADCAEGEATIQDLFGGSSMVRATFTLISDFVGVLDTQTSTSFFLVSGRTATVAASFEVR